MSATRRVQQAVGSNKIHISRSGLSQNCRLTTKSIIVTILMYRQISSSRFLDPFYRP